MVAARSCNPARSLRMGGKSTIYQGFTDFRDLTLVSSKN